MEMYKETKVFRRKEIKIIPSSSNNKENRQHLDVAPYSHNLHYKKCMTICWEKKHLYLTVFVRCRV